MTITDTSKISKAMTQHLRALHAQERAAARCGVQDMDRGMPMGYTPGLNCGYGFHRRTAMALLDRGLVHVGRDSGGLVFTLSADGRRVVSDV